jgi:hypothetical protein
LPVCWHLSAKAVARLGFLLLDPKTGLNNRDDYYGYSLSFPFQIAALFSRELKVKESSRPFYSYFIFSIIKGLT